MPNVPLANEQWDDEDRKNWENLLNDLYSLTQKARKRYEGGAQGVIPSYTPNELHPTHYELTPDEIEEIKGQDVPEFRVSYIESEPLCPGCGHPMRFHGNYGCAGCECTYLHEDTFSQHFRSVSTLYLEGPGIANILEAIRLLANTNILAAERALGELDAIAEILEHFEP
jgi:hypothetical protein